MARWLQLKLSQLISQLHLLAITRGRGLRWRRICRQLVQAGAVLLLIVGAVPLPAMAASLHPGCHPRSIQDLTSQPQHQSLAHAPGDVVMTASPPSQTWMRMTTWTAIYRRMLLARRQILREHGQCHQPGFLRNCGSLNPLNIVDVGYFSTPASLTWMEMATWMLSSVQMTALIRTFQNTGTATSPAFTQLTGTLNPFNGVDVGNYSAPSFADLDADGDLDAFIGVDAWHDPYYFQNTGSATSPVFSELHRQPQPLQWCGCWGWQHTHLRRPG